MFLVLLLPSEVGKGEAVRSRCPIQFPLIIPQVRSSIYSFAWSFHLVPADGLTSGTIARQTMKVYSIFTLRCLIRTIVIVTRSHYLSVVPVSLLTLESSRKKRKYSKYYRQVRERVSIVNSKFSLSGIRFPIKVLKFTANTSTSARYNGYI